jgi:hypothetical protein
MQKSPVLTEGPTERATDIVMPPVAYAAWAASSRTAAAVPSTVETRVARRVVTPVLSAGPISAERARPLKGLDLPGRSWAGRGEHTRPAHANKRYAVTRVQPYDCSWTIDCPRYQRTVVHANRFESGGAAKSTVVGGSDVAREATAAVGGVHTDW